jgi:hypothetical protein
MDWEEEFVRDDLISEKVKEQQANTIELPISYLHHFTPMKLTTELRMITEETELSQLIGQISWALDNALDLSPAMSMMAESITPLAEVAGVEIE